MSRIDNWLTQYLGAGPSDYIRAVGAKFLIGAVARIYWPADGKTLTSRYTMSPQAPQQVVVFDRQE